MKNSVLYEAIKKLAKEIIDIYHQKYASSENGTLFFLLLGVDKTMGELKGFKEAKEIIEKDTVISSHLERLVGDSNMRMRVGNSQEVIASFMRQLYTDFEKFDEKIFDQHYFYFEDFFHEDYLTYAYRARLYNFELENKQDIIIKDGLEIKYSPISHKERFEKYKFFDISDYELAIEVKTKKHFDNEECLDFPPYSVAYQSFEYILKAMRIIKTSNVYRDFQITAKHLTFHPHAGNFSHGISARKNLMPSFLKLNNSEVEELKSIYEYLLKASNTPKLKNERRFSIALSRLKLGGEREELEDKLLDYMIGLEALYLPDDMQELIFKLALRASLVINDGNRENAKSDFTFLKNMYNTRSKIVHGTNSDITEQDILKLENILRNSLKLWMNSPGRFDKSYLSTNIYFD